MGDEEIEQLRESIKTMRQALCEVAHAQREGAGWYTRGSSGLYQQVSMWVRRGRDAAEAAEQLINQHDKEEGS
jgi:hypothetical protein